MNKYYGIIVSSIAGISTLVGYLFIYIKADKNKVISKSLSFASGVMLTLSLVDLIPTSINYLNMDNRSLLYAVLFFFVGIILCLIINTKIKDNDVLYKTGILSMIGIMIHNIPEGIVTYILSTVDMKLGLIFAIAIILHNIPEGISISVPIYYSKKSKKKAFLYTMISGLSEPLGALLSMIFLYKYISNFLIAILFSLIAGLMSYISIFELMKTSFKYDKNKIYILYGSLFILIVEILLKI